MYIFVICNDNDNDRNNVTENESCTDSENGFDLIYLDGPHKFDEVMVEFFYASQLLKVNGIIYFDDQSLGSVHRVCAFIYQNLEKEGIYEVIKTPSFPATCAFKKISKDNRDWSHYKLF